MATDRAVEDKAMKACVTLLLLCPLLVVLAAGDSPPKEKAQEQITVTVQGVQIIGEDYKGELIGGSDPGITVALLALIREREIVQLKRERSKLEVFQDDRGTDLLLGLERSPFGFSFLPSTDRRAVAFEVASGQIPAARATHLTIAGTLCVEVGVNKKTVTFESLPMRAENKITLGSITYTITQMGDNEMLERGFRQRQPRMVVILEGPSDFPDIIEVKFFDEEGTEIPSLDFPWAFAVDLDEDRVTQGSRTILLRRIVDPATVQVTYWAEKRHVIVPFNLKVTLGPGGPQPVEKDGPEPDIGRPE